MRHFFFFLLALTFWIGAETKMITSCLPCSSSARELAGGGRPRKDRQVSVGRWAVGVPLVVLYRPSPPDSHGVMLVLQMKK